MQGAVIVVGIGTLSLSGGEKTIGSGLSSRGGAGVEPGIPDNGCKLERTTTVPEQETIAMAKRNTRRRICMVVL